MYSKGPGFFIFFQETDIIAGAGYPVVIIYESLPKKTIRKITKKIKKPKDKAYKKPSKEAIDKIVQALVKEWPKKELQEKMDFYDLTEEEAILSYEKTLLNLINDDLALLLIMVLA